MPDEIFLVVTLRCPVPDRQTGHDLYELVKQRVADHPEVKVSGHLTNHFDTQETPPA